MCGLAGVISWDPRFPVTRDLLARMSARIAHRGPDGQGLYLSHEGDPAPDRPQVGLVHRRLAVIDLDPRANQPFTDGRGRWLVFNGEIYNYRELRRELEPLLPDWPWHTTSDTEVLLASYAVWGHDCVRHLNGMFAFAVWDAPKGELFLARDRMGQKPLYYSVVSEGEGEEKRARAIAFASEASSLRAVPWAGGGELSPEALHEYLSWGYCVGFPASFDCVAPATSVRFSAQPGGNRDGRYFAHMVRGPREKEWLGLPHAARVAEARRLVEQAVSRQLVADVPVGCLLSGGIDSSVTAACMKAAVPPGQRVLTFSIGFEDPRYDETKYAAEVARHLGTEHHAFTVRPNVIEDLPKLAAVFGEPFADSSALPTHYLARETRRHVKVALSGDGGDELFGGYDRYRAMRLTERLHGLPQPLRVLTTGRVARAVAQLLPGVHPKSPTARLKRLMAAVSHPAPDRYESYLRLFDDETIAQLILAPSRHVLAFRKMNRLRAARFWTYGRTRDVAAAAAATDRETYLPGDLLTKVDRCSMLHALEVRSPFMDHELVRFASTLTGEEMFKGGPKRMLREAFADALPAWVFKRKKMGFAVPVGEWFRADLRPMLRDHLFAAGSFARGHFAMPVVQRLVEEHERQRVDHAQRLYALLMLELWWRGRAG